MLARRLNAGRGKRGQSPFTHFYAADCSRRWRSGVFGFLGLKALKAVSWKPCWFLQLETSFIKIKFFGEVEGCVR